MLIRHKIVIWFTIFVSFVLLLFSAYVYISFDSYREQSITERLETRARTTEYLLSNDGKVIGSISSTLPEQVDFIFSGTDSLVYKSSDKFDFYPTKELLDSIRNLEKLHFTYESAGHVYPKDAGAVTYYAPGQKKGERPYIGLVTAYDLEGHKRLFSLKDLFVYGNLFFVLLIGILAYFFAARVLLPLNALLKQLKDLNQTSLSFRLKNFNPKDEIGTLALAFNDLLEQQERLIASQRAFISQASHELRTPMSSLKGLLQTSILYDRDRDSLVKSIKSATSELDRLVSLSNGLLQLARVENEEDFIHTHQVDLIETVMDSIDAVQNAWPHQPIRLNISDGVCQQTNALLVSGEQTLLKVAIDNLIENACKYSDGKPVSVHLEMNTERQIRLLITDHGMGIPESDMNRVLQPLIRGSNVNHATGFGIGLTLAHKIIRLHRSGFDMKSKVSEGTKVTLTFDLILMT
ncbi:MAG TPA: HAMP domain-containing sensor histidine kinase [Dyadobacter sp.]|jgi:signal transduction histidine kinase|nr:HAMP domain-containing sensor histidine kinase [Dyadobacter sp.]